MTRFGSASARLLVNVDRKIAMASKMTTANDTRNRGAGLFATSASKNPKCPLWSPRCPESVYDQPACARSPIRWRRPITRPPRSCNRPGRGRTSTASRLPRDSHPQITLDRLAMRPIEVGRVVGSGKEADVLRDRRDDATANLERGRAKRGRQHDGAERRPVGGPEIAPQVGLQVGPDGRLADDIGAQQAGADPAAERVVGIEADRREQVPGRGRSRRVCQMICACGSSARLCARKKG